VKMLDFKKDTFAHLVLSAQSMREDVHEESAPLHTGKDMHGPKHKITIDEKFENPMIAQIRGELDEAAQIFHRIKAVEKNKTLILRIQNKLMHLRAVVEEKSYY
jgi:hypothetical protein